MHAAVLRYFEAVAEEGSIRRASERLSVSASAVNRQVPCAMHAIMAPDHDLAGRSSVTLDECGAYPLIYQENSSSMGAFLGDEMEAFKRAHQPVLTSNSLALMKRLLLRGAGIAFYTRLGFVEELSSGRLVAVRLEDERLTQLRLSLIMSSDRSPTVAVRAMAEHLQGALARFAADFETRAA